MANMTVRVLRGDPDDEEICALLIALQIAGGRPARTAPPGRPRLRWRNGPLWQDTVYRVTEPVLESRIPLRNRPGE